MAFPHPLRRPLLHSLFQRHPYLLQVLHLRQLLPLPLDPLHRTPQPVLEHPSQLLVLRPRQPLRQRVRYPQQVLRRPTLLQPHHRPHQIPARHRVRPDPLLVHYEVALRRLVRRQPLPHRRDQLAHLLRRAPRVRAVVEHYRQHRRQAARLLRFLPLPPLPTLVAQPLLVHQADVDQDAQRHVVVIARLELQQHQQIGPLVSHPQPPYGVPVALQQLVADVLGRQLLQRREVYGSELLAAEEGAHEVLDHAREGEQHLVPLVVPGTGLASGAHYRIVAVRSGERQSREDAQRFEVPANLGRQRHRFGVEVVELRVDVPQRLREVEVLLVRSDADVAAGGEAGCRRSWSGWRS